MPSLLCDKPTFLLLPESHIFPASLGPKVLGALCDKMDDPVADFKPNNASKVLSAKLQSDPDSELKPLMMFMESTHHTLERTTSKKAKAKLQNLLEFVWYKESGEKYDLKSQWTRTVRLPQQSDVFEAILSDESVQKFRRQRDKERYFMITGYKTCLNATVIREKAKGSGPEVDLTIPVELILTAAGVPIPPGVVPEVGLSGTWNTSWSSLDEHTLKGEYIFAVEYREVLKRPLLWDLLGRRKTDRYQRRTLVHRAHGFKKGTALMGGGTSSTDEADEGLPDDYMEIEAEDGEDDRAEEVFDEIPTVQEYLKESVNLASSQGGSDLVGMAVSSLSDLDEIFLVER